KDRGGATLTEVFPGPDELVAHGPSERFTHELIIPFVRSAESGSTEFTAETAPRGHPAQRAEQKRERIESESAGAQRSPQGSYSSSIPSPSSSSAALCVSAVNSVRSFPPGSEWLYAKLYTGAATMDQVLREVVAPLVEELTESRAADRWFFIRYGDP